MSCCRCTGLVVEKEANVEMAFKEHVKNENLILLIRYGLAVPV